MVFLGNWVGDCWSIAQVDRDPSIFEFSFVDGNSWNIHTSRKFLSSSCKDTNYHQHQLDKTKQWQSVTSSFCFRDAALLLHFGNKIDIWRIMMRFCVKQNMKHFYKSEYFYKKHIFESVFIMLIHFFESVFWFWNHFKFISFFKTILLSLSKAWPKSAAKLPKKSGEFEPQILV